jgi:hypothetical protein
MNCRAADDRNARQFKTVRDCRCAAIDDDIGTGLVRAVVLAAVIGAVLQIPDDIRAGKFLHPCRIAEGRNERAWRAIIGARMAMLKLDARLGNSSGRNRGEGARSPGSWWLLIVFCAGGVMALTIMKQVARIGRGGAVTVALLLTVALPQEAEAQADGVDPVARQLLKASTDFLARQQQFSLDTASSIEVVLASGQKIQYDHSAKVAVERPNKWRAERTGEVVDQVFYYDGKSLTLHNPEGNYYATIAAPGTLEEMLDFARAKLDVVAPAGDLIYKNAYDLLMQDVVSGFVVGKGVVDGVRCDHLAFRAPHVDWQIWIEEGARPLVRKLVITTRDKLNAPQFTVVAKNWNLKPKFTAATFSYVPPQCPQQVEFLLQDAEGLKAK